MTQKQYELVTGEKPSYFNNESCYATRPVESVSYGDIRGFSDGAGWPESSAIDADSFLGKVRVLSGLSLDLPTEAQWEYACRAGTTSAYNNGDNINQLGRYRGNRVASYSRTDDTGNGTAKVGSYLPNAWGLYDMHGNVCEWTLDWYQSSLQGGNDPKGATGGSYRVFRGGSWYDSASNCTSSYRYSIDPIYNIYLGFRLCCPAGL